MASLRLDGFGGIAPIFDPRKLPAHAATIARNCKFDGTDFRPLFAHLDAASPMPFATSRLFKYKFQASNIWLGWPAPNDVDVVFSPIPEDSLGRLYWSSVNPDTVDTPTEDNYPRAATQPTQAQIGTSAVRRLGVPEPANAPMMVEIRGDHSVSSAATPPTLTAMSQTSPVTCTAVGHSMKNGWTVIVEAEAGTDDGMKEMVGLKFTVFNVTDSTFDLIGADGSNYTAFDAGTKIKISRVYADSDMETRSYVYTYVTDWGEESAPSPPNDPVDIQYDSVTHVTCSTAVEAWGKPYVNRIRLYRTATGSQSTDFYYVTEAAIGVDPILVIEDSVEPAGLGELLPTTSWTPAPNGLRGLAAMPNGFLVGFKGNTLYFSEPYLPHAWPDAYRKTTQDDIVGIAVYGQTLVVATLGKPYIASGVDPGSVSMAHLDIDAPCLNKGGLCSIGSGVVYPTPDGLAYVNASGAQIVTLPYITKRQWADMWSLTADAIFHDNRYIAFSREAGKRTLIVERRSDGSLAISDCDLVARAPAIDPDDDSLNFVLVNGASSNARWVFEGGASQSQGTWQSYVYTAAHAVNMAVGQVFASGYPVTMTVRYANLQAATGQPTGEATDNYSVTVTGPEVFRLPSGFMSREWQLQLESSYAVQGCLVSSSMSELRQT